MDFECIYRGYVIKEKDGAGMYVGETSDMFRVSRRGLAARFTREEAIEYIEKGIFCEKGDFVIEDAV